LRSPQKHSFLLNVSPRADNVIRRISGDSSVDGSYSTRNKNYFDGYESMVEDSVAANDSIVDKLVDTEQIVNENDTKDSNSHSSGSLVLARIQNINNKLKDNKSNNIPKPIPIKKTFENNIDHPHRGNSVTELNGRLKRNREIQRRNPRRETGGSNVLAPRHPKLVHPMFRRHTQEEQVSIETEQLHNNFSYSDDDDDDDDDSDIETINEILSNAGYDQIKFDDIMTTVSNSTMSQASTKNKQEKQDNNDESSQYKKQVSFNVDNEKSIEISPPSTPDTFDLLLASTKEVDTPMLQQNKENISSNITPTKIERSKLCLSPIQRTPQQARKWRTLKAAVEEKEEKKKWGKFKDNVEVLRRKSGNKFLLN